MNLLAHHHIPGNNWSSIYYAYPMQNGQIVIQTVLKLFVFLKTHVYQSTVFWKGKNYGLKTASLEH